MLLPGGLRSNRDFSIQIGLVGSFSYRGGSGRPALNRNALLTESHFNDIKTTRGVIAHVTDADSARIPLNSILAVLDFILLGIKTIFFDKMGKPKSKLQLILSLPAIIKFVAEVINRINTDLKKPNRVKGISNEQKAVDAIDKAVKKAKDG